METAHKHSICPVERARALDFGIRKLVHNPRKMLRPYVTDGMTVLDLGCGPGFFTMEMARLVGKAGKVIAADLQEGMLDIVRNKIQKNDFVDRVKLHLCRPDAIGLSEKCDFILIFYMLHEVPEPVTFFREINALLKADGRVLVVEPKWHVTAADFLKSIAIATQAGLAVEAEPKIGFSRAVLVRLS